MLVQKTNNNKYLQMKYFILLGCVSLLCSVLAGPVPAAADKETVEVICDGCTGAELAETVRKARQIYEDISVDIVSGGGGRK